MRIPRCYIDHTLATGDILELPEGTARHIAQVLRMRSGETLRLFNGQDGRDYSAELVDISKRAVRVRIETADEPQPPTTLGIQLAIGISKGERMDFVLQKSTELGVSEIIPLFTERSVVRLSEERMAKRLEHWQGVITSACEQSGRAWLPHLYQPHTLEEWLSKKRPATLLLDHRAAHTLVERPQPHGEIALLIGPEGGLAATEREMAIGLGCNGIRLGPRILRTETAPLAAIAAIQTLWGDFR